MDKEIKASSDALDNSISAKAVPLKNVLDQSEEIKANVEEAAGQIGSVNAVLTNDAKVMPPFPTIDEVIAQNEEAEKKVVKAAEDLQQVNAELTKQVAERINIESELRETKNDLLEVRADLSKSQEKEKGAIHIALHDPLTGLPNRLLLEQRLEHGLTQSRRYDRKLALMFIDLDKFKNINDSYGHAIGDRVLITVAKRLQAFIRGEDIVSRWGGDEFVCVLLNINLESDVISLAEKMVNRISETCEFDGIVLSISATIGIAICPRDGETAEILFKQVDRAMYKSKGTDQRVMLFNASILDSPDDG
ncbi:diguanylate cyclase/phosphodiesterasewith PAS/PAC sensor [Pseudanabaena sp. lw0831]|uniref:diguanylate cyclase domain-containing protein n=1 Tax=Pseudanabaena sp. lw0831 TaxID=1357935 RepID=UPI0019158F8B|nr:diguanylate cyclase [Pseudanabaena sp. lw0831]GBO51515.1 diguanylate cyclase/phosphodiesterasewith PAS/PAC sensor [Pseudanabaena sp. lw0831]